MEKIKIDKGSYDKFIFKGSLALEAYFEYNDDNKDIFDEFNDKLKNYRLLLKKDDSSKEFIVNELILVFEKIGKEDFIFYEDGDVEYNYNNLKKEGDNND